MSHSPTNGPSSTIDAWEKLGLASRLVYLLIKINIDYHFCMMHNKNKHKENFQK